MNFMQLFAVVSLPTLIALVGVILNQGSNRTLAEEVKNFRKAINIRLDGINQRFDDLIERLDLTKRIENLERQRDEKKAGTQ